MQWENGAPEEQVEDEYVFLWPPSCIVDLFTLAISVPLQLEELAIGSVLTSLPPLSVHKTFLSQGRAIVTSSPTIIKLVDL